MAKKRLTPDEFYADLAEPQKSIALEARALVLATEPDIVEDIKYGVPFYSREGWMCYVNVTKKNGVTLGFMSGTVMSDTFDLFAKKEQDLKLVRFIELPSVTFIREKRDEITNYVIEALVINDSKTKK
ncbi:MAG: DUF1801 domain-containing protein [Candidatus Kapabacteria bacterium]|nr:DUF1801 domain-containing protein [Candidatus Kapabacteria bacterium]